MAIRVALNHKSIYRYNRLVELGPQVVRLRPAPHNRTPVTAYSMRVLPETHFCNWQQDPQSNHLARLVFPKPTRVFEVEVDLVAELTVINPFDFFLESFAEQYPFSYPQSLSHEIEPYCRKQPAGKDFAEFLSRVDVGPARTIDFLVALNRQVNDEIAYVIRLEPGVQSCNETLEKRSGSCRDSAWLLVQLLRHLGLAARFVSGYLIQLKADVKSLDGPSGTENDFTDLHAWVEVYLPGAGWIGLDPTSGLMAGEGHIPLACSPDPQSAAPITGMVEDCEVEFHHEMTVTRIHEDPRVTKPYSEGDWARICSLGEQIDVDLLDDDVRLTMGGEPTFVSIDDMEGEEWNTAALGKMKRERAGVLTRQLKKRFSQGALLHAGQGKWYPGESLPRWELSCYWRPDGEPIWQDDKLLADDETDYQHDDSDAERFIRHLGDRLGVAADHCVAGYEDAWYHMWREQRLPNNVDPLDSRLDDPEERTRLARVFEKGLDRIVGYALPLRRNGSNDDVRWQSGEWTFRANRMFLIPGDSPMGLRLPLESLPWLAPEKRPEPVSGRDPFEDRSPLAPLALWRTEPIQAKRTSGELLARASASSNTATLEMPARSLSTESKGDSSEVRTALCVEPRDGRLHVFMPPAETLESYLELIAEVEETARALDTPIVIEGYAPPHDWRIKHFKVTPDPGVIEVNIHPAHSWEELVENTTALYEEARLARLAPEKFMLDGRHTGTGGGNHIVIGGPTPADSPILRRPHLLRSIIAYWHNHPSLSYIFAGMFVGPTSQAPRVEEARVDSIYELEIAFEQIPDGDAPSWLIDRALRHLLVDVTGNTHRAEICIDKLFSPDSSTGRMGLVEFRGFEMPPHARMSLTQQLLLRGLIARFWKNPYRKPLAQWGSELYDRFALPHFLQQDFQDVIEETREAGYPLETAWFEPHFEFRFPKLGHIEQRGIKVELRQALEPWYVLGEQSSIGGTARYVDSSVERIQLKTAGLIDRRHVITCNGKRVPMHPTGVNGEYVAGVRYRAWQPPSCLHPTIPVHAPLVIDVFDTWSGRSIGGCTYHVAHPGGLSYETLPVNAHEAESRRISRFLTIGHTPGRTTLEAVDCHPRYPMTLDLRAC